jgi:hypothetical protein
MPILGSGDVQQHVLFFCTPAACCGKLNGGNALSRVYGNVWLNWINGRDALSRVHGNVWLNWILMRTRSGASLRRRFIQ